MVIDWDGTLVPSAWPDRPSTMMQGAPEAVRAFLDAGHHVTVFSARLSPYDPWSGGMLPAHLVAAEVQYIRSTLDAHGLTDVAIWTLEGKPPGTLYIDDRAVWYPGRPRSWEKLTPRLLARLENEKPWFPVIRGEEHTSTPTSPAGSKTGEE